MPDNLIPNELKSRNPHVPSHISLKIIQNQTLLSEIPGLQVREDYGKVGGDLGGRHSAAPRGVACVKEGVHEIFFS